MKTIYLNPRSDVPGIVKMLTQAASPAVILVVPKASKLFRSPHKLKLLKEEAALLNREVIIATANAGARALARAAGFRVVKGETAGRGGSAGLVSDSLGTATAGSKPLKARWLPVLARPARAGALVTVDRGTLTKSLISVLAGLLLVALVLVILPTASVAVTLRTEPVTRDLEIRVAASQNEVDAASLVIPGRILEQEATGTKTLSPTGIKNVGKRASGFVQIYNLTKNTLILKAETTQLTVGEKVYVMTQDASGIRPTAFIGQDEAREADPSSLISPVPIVAREAGEAYNLPEGTRIEIRNEAFGFQPDVLYGLVSGGVSGGETKEVKVLTDSDIENGYAVLSAELVEQGRKELDPTGQVKLLDNATRVEPLERSVSHQAGAETEEFQVSMRIKFRALVYGQDDVRQIVRERIERLLPANKQLDQSEGTVLESRFFVVNLEEGSGVLATHFEGRLQYQLVSVEEVRDRLTGKSETEIKELLLSRPEVAAVDVKFSPFWVSKAPRLKGRIQIDIQSEELD